MYSLCFLRYLHRQRWFHAVGPRQASPTLTQFEPRSLAHGWYHDRQQQHRQHERCRHRHNYGIYVQLSESNNGLGLGFETNRTCSRTYRLFSGFLARSDGSSMAYMNSNLVSDRMPPGDGQIGSEIQDSVPGISL